MIKKQWYINKENLDCCFKIEIIYLGPYCITTIGMSYHKLLYYLV